MTVYLLAFNANSSTRASVLRFLESLTSYWVAGLVVALSKEFLQLPEFSNTFRYELDLGLTCDLRYRDAGL